MPLNLPNTYDASLQTILRNGGITLAIYHLNAKYVSRRQGRSSIAAAAYRSGEKLYDRYNGQFHDFTNRKDIIHKEILLPDNAPYEFNDRETLWNTVEASEKRSDSRTAREVEIALPNELELKEIIKLVRGYICENFVNLGMCADIAIHSGKQKRKKNIHDLEKNIDVKNHIDNPHAHVLLTTRAIESNGFSPKKNREWDKKEKLILWREQWAKMQNAMFKQKGLKIELSHESYTTLDIEREPTIHLGHAVIALERNGKSTDRGNKNREIIARNTKREEQKQQAKERSRKRARGRSR